MYLRITRILKNFILSLLGYKTIGARALVIKNDNVLLIKHSYTKNKDWCTIGGGVEKGETPNSAIIRELYEEVGIVGQKNNTFVSPDNNNKMHLSAQLFAIYHSNQENRDDYIVFYIVKDFNEQHDLNSKEILLKKWFNIYNLPNDISPATKRHIDEYLKLRPISEIW